MFNAYLYTGAGHTVVLCENVRYDDAVAACRAQLLYLPKVGRLGDTWVGAGLVPRLAVVSAEQDEMFAYLRDRYQVRYPIDYLLAKLSANYEKP